MSKILRICNFLILLFVFSRVLDKNTLADIGWGIGFILVALFSLFAGGFFDWKHIILNFLVLVWGMRLTIHLFPRLFHHEDFRYENMKKEAKNEFVSSFLKVFMLQGLFMLILSTPIIFVNSTSSTYLWLDIFDYVGILIFIIGFSFELIADHQLEKFITNPKNKGKLMTKGLYKYSRHPNYFGESLIWFGLFFFSLSIPFGWVSIISPITITYLLLFVTGVPLLEARLRKHPHWDDYEEKTSVFVPWFRKK